MNAFILIVLIMQTIINQSFDKKMEITFEGYYVTGRGPCQVLHDGTRRWPRTTGFKVIRSELDFSYVEIEYQMIQKRNFELNQIYLITIHLSEERFKELKLDQPNTRLSYRNPIKVDEIIKVEKIK